MARLERPSFQVIDFVDDLRLVEADGLRGRLSAEFSPARPHTSTRVGGGRCWPTRSIPRVGFIVNAGGGAIETEPRKRQKGRCLSNAVMRFQARPSLSAPVVLSTVSSLIFPR